MNFREINKLTGKELYRLVNTIYFQIQRDKKRVEEYVEKENKRWFWKKKTPMPNFEIVDPSVIDLDRMVAWNEIEFSYLSIYEKFERDYEMMLRTTLESSSMEMKASTIKIHMLESMMEVLKDNPFDYVDMVKIKED
ncbi:MAG: hypothetical protein ACRDDY_04220 [Clostridium sp.]|uniref:hypothetical protein n=1 Tax=Clostridium sp. TaxID=1506 RepID=UPI003EE43F0A